MLNLVSKIVKEKFGLRFNYDENVGKQRQKYSMKM